jgi:hypothetical protein
MNFDAFISYANQDKAAADAACAVLESVGIRCWIAPRDIRPGREFADAIIEAIDHCRVMVLIFSASANESAQIHREIERAVSKGACRGRRASAPIASPTGQQDRRASGPAWRWHQSASPTQTRSNAGDDDARGPTSSDRPRMAQ